MIETNRLRLPSNLLSRCRTAAHGSDANHSPNARHTALFAAFSPAARYVPAAGGSTSAKYPVVCGLDGATEYEMTADGYVDSGKEATSKL